MRHRKYLLILFIAVLANFIAQIPYYLHQYHSTPSIVGSILLTFILAWFLVSFVWLWQGKQRGYVMMMLFLIVEFLFYLSTQITQATSGKGILLHVISPDDPILFVVFGIGYLNLIVSAVFIVFTFINHRNNSKLAD